MKNSPSPIKKQTQIENPEIKAKISSINKPVDYKKLSFDEIVAQNKQILNVLKGLQQKLTEYISTVQTKKLFSFKQGKNHGTQLTEQYKVLQQQINNKKKLIASLKADQEAADKRIQKINAGLESKTNDRKFDMEKKIGELKQWIKKTKIQQHETEKVLGSHQNKNDYLGCTEHDRLEQELRAYSIKYVRLMDSYNKSVEKLAISSSIKDIPDDFQIPQEIFNEDIEKRQAQQFKQYQSIVKLCTILQKRNDSEHNKAHRIYTQRLKQLEKIINSLGQIDRLIAQREGQLLQSRKSIQIVKIHMQKGDVLNFPELPNISRRTLGSVSEMSRGKSYSSIKPKINTRDRQFSIAKLQPAYGSTKS